MNEPVRLIAGRLRCRGRDSNPHDLIGQRILSPLRLPFRHPGISNVGL